MTAVSETRPARDGAIPAREGVLEIGEQLRLHHGGSLAGVRIAWRIAGHAGLPLVAALGGISAHRRVYSPEPTAPGWWDEVVAPGGAVPAERLRILSFDWLGGSGDTTGPRGGAGFPAISSYDQADLLARLLDHLGIERLSAILGASYGGMVALAFAERHPLRVQRLVVISAADRTHPLATAWRCVQRRTLRLAIRSGRSVEGLQLARALAMATYRSSEEFARRFGGEPRRASAQEMREGGAGAFVFPVESYLMSRGEQYAARYQPDGFLCLSESIDLHRIPDVAAIRTPTLAIGVLQDQLVPIADMRALVSRLPNAELVELSSIYGHDAFLKEARALAGLFAPLFNGSRLS